MASSNTLGKRERLKSRKVIGQLFSGGQAFSLFPLRVLYQLGAPGLSPLQAGFSVSIRNFKKATDRNRIKRLLRECYRTQKSPLVDLTAKHGPSLSVFFIFTAKEIPDYQLIKEKIALAIEMLAKKNSGGEMMRIILQILSFPFVILIKLYQWIISPLLQPSCRFNPSCSNYALQAFQKYGPIKGLWLSARRIVRCHPWGGHGEDPVP